MMHSRPGTATRPSRPGTATRSSRPGTATRPSPPGIATRPSTADTASGESRGEKICCYQCYRQAYHQHAIEVEDAQQSTSRLVCSEDCANRLRQLLAVREKRE